MKEQIKALLDAKCLTQREKEELLEKVIHLCLCRARNNFYTFVKLMAHIVLPTDYVDGRHVKIICDLLERTVRQLERPGNYTDITNPCISLPPGSSKSVLCSQLLPSWALGRNPHWFILAVGHSENFMVDNSGRKAKDILQSRKFRIMFPGTKIREDVQAAGRFYTDANGMFVCAGWTTNIAGRRAKLAILDDVVSEQSAASDSEMKRIRDWYGGGLDSRLLSQGAIVNLCTRWRPDDLIGYLLDLDKKSKTKRFLPVRFPALNDKISSKILKLPEGESFWPELWPKEVFYQKRDINPPHKWQSLYLQNPVPEEGNYIKWDWCRRWEHDDPPPCEFVIMSLDTASTKEKTNDPTGYVVMGLFRRQYRGFKGDREGETLQMMVLDAGEERLDYVQLLDFIDNKMSTYRVDVLLVEEVPISMLLVQDLKRRAYPVVGIKPRQRGGGGTGNKIDRMLIAQPSFMNGRVYFPDNKRWADDVISKLCQFPHGPSDDFADAMSQAVTWVQNNYNLHTDNELDYDPYDDDAALNDTAPQTYWAKSY